MNTETFNKLLDELDGNSLETMKQKNAKYASSEDCLHNFDSGAEIMGGSAAQCAWGYMTKHLVALRDKVEKNDFTDREDLLEKCQDIINYIRFIWVIGNEDRAKYDECLDQFGSPPWVPTIRCDDYVWGMCLHGNDCKEECDYKPGMGCRYRP